MESSDEKKGAHAPEGKSTPAAPGDSQPESSTAAGDSSTGRDPYDYYDNGYPYEDTQQQSVAVAPETSPAPPAPAAVPAAAAAGGGGGTSPPPPTTGENDEEEGMLRMSFLEHLEELRRRIFYALIGVGVAFVVSLTFSSELWRFISAPAIAALKQLGYTQHLVMITPMESFNILWVKLPILSAVFLSSPWILYQVWAFIAPGLYRRERRWATPFVICTAGLFIAGGVFAYFVAFRYGLTFLLSLGRGNYIEPMVTITEYFDLFVNVTLGVGLVFEMPVLIFFLTLLHVLSPRWLVRNSRYAILVIVVIAAVITPTPDVFNLMLFATPMCLLFYVGIFASYLLVLRRENRRFPWAKLFYVIGVILFLIAAAIYFATSKYGYHLVPYWPFLTR